MKSPITLPRTLALGLAIGLLCSARLRAQAPAAPAPTRTVIAPGVLAPDAPRGTSAISGTIIDASGRPIAGATVTVSGRTANASRFSVAQITTPRGRFLIDQLPACEDCTVVASKPGYLEGGYGRTEPRGPAAPLRLAAGEWINDIRVILQRPAAISGTVVDERGEPITGAFVRALPQLMVAGRLQWLAGRTAQTDDRGEYRISGLGAGKYVVSVPSVQATLPASATLKPPTALAGTSLPDLEAARAASRAEPLVVDRGAGIGVVVGRYAVSPSPMPDGRPAAYPITFYPNATRPDEATAIDVGPGDERAGVDFALRPVPTARVSGMVQGPREAAGNILLRLMPAGMEEMGQGSEAATTMTLADGRFTFLDVPYGSYVLNAQDSRMEFMSASADDAPTAIPSPVAFSAQSARAGGVRAAPPGVEFSALSGGASMGYWTRTPVDVAGDATDVVAPLRRPAVLRGRLVLPPGATDVPRVQLALEPAGGERTLGMPLWSLDPRSADPLAFELTGLLAGGYVLRPFGPGDRVASISWNGEDYIGRPFDLSRGTDIDGVVVTLLAAPSSISGTVTTPRGSSAVTAAVIAFPSDRERWSNYGLNPQRIASVHTTQDGRFRIDGLPPGDYQLVAVPPTEERAWIDPRYLELHVGRSTRVRIDAGSSPINGITLSWTP